MLDADKQQSASPEEIALVFSCKGSQLIGVLHQAEHGQEIGLVVVVGGHQTRVGSHRQFVQLARALASNNIPVLRFDYRGMGDSEGPSCDFEHRSDDIRAAVDVLQEHTGVQRVVLWGLCDAVPKITSYASTDERICGIVLLNPWVRTTVGVARTYMRKHYAKRLFSGEFWARLTHGELNVFDSASLFVDNVRRALFTEAPNYDSSSDGDAPDFLPLPARVFDGVERFDGPILLVLSGNDITAQEFHRAAESSPSWRRVLNRGCVMHRELADADHTFSSRAWSRQVELWTEEWVKML